MCYLLLASVSTNPAHGPEILGAVIDCLLTATIIINIVLKAKERRTK